MSPPPPVNIGHQDVAREMFEYEGPPMLFEQEWSQEEADGIRTIDLRLIALDGEKASAFLVEPMGEGKHPAILFLHPAPGDRSFFMEEARDLARRGAVSLLVSTPWADAKEWGRALMDPEAGRERIVRTVVELRRDLDFLASRETVDPNRLGFMGMSLGAMFGGILSGIDEKAMAYVLMSGVASFTDVATLNIPILKGEALERYRAAMAPLDPVNFVGRASPAELLFQYGRRDVFPIEELERFVAAGSQPKTLMVYNAGHFLDDQARGDAVDWLVERLGAGSSPMLVPAGL